MPDHPIHENAQHGLRVYRMPDLNGIPWVSIEHYADRATRIDMSLHDVMAIARQFDLEKLYSLFFVSQNKPAAK